MTISVHKNIIIDGKHNKPILIDVYLPQNIIPQHTIIYCHGFKGFKDWGTNDLMAQFFAEKGINFIKFNFSHNGGTPQQPIDFPDLEAFGNNNFTKELDDLDCVLSWIAFQTDFEYLTIEQALTVMGHSRGSGTAIIKAKEDNRIDKVISLAGVSDYQSRFNDPPALDYWKKTGTVYVENSRTKQQLPLYFQLYEDLIDNMERLKIENAAKALGKPHLIIHGTDDLTVTLDEAIAVHHWSKNSTLEIIEGADHVFNVKHPWGENDVLPDNYIKMLHKCLNFVVA